MVGFLKIAAVAGGALIASALPVVAQSLNPLGIDLDPLHIFTPAPPPPGAPAVYEHHHHWHHHHWHHVHHHHGRHHHYGNRHAVKH
jgi:hypothetical protein